MLKGVIDNLVEDSGYGFIKPDDRNVLSKTRTGIFFHKSGLANTAFDDLSRGMRVEFETEETDKGPKAINIRVV